MDSTKFLECLEEIGKSAAVDTISKGNLDYLNRVLGEYEVLASELEPKRPDLSSGIRKIVKDIQRDAYQSGAFQMR